jgi:DNA-binding NarL/FixJ family response regulator
MTLPKALLKMWKLKMKGIYRKLENRLRIKEIKKYLIWGFMKIMIVEDHPVVVEGLKKLLLDAGIAELCLTASDGRECLLFLMSFKPDIILLDINLPDINGIDLCKTIKSKYPEYKVLAISSFSERSYISHMMSNGASGYVLKNASEEEIIDAVKTIYEGGTYLSDDVQEILRKDNRNAEIPLLTNREKEVLQLLADGFTNKEIGDKLFISPLTVDSHRKNLIMKLEAKNTPSLIKIAITKNLIDFKENEIKSK